MSKSDKKIITYIIEIICIALLAIPIIKDNLEFGGVYIFGLIFFTSGLFIGMFLPVFGLIFLFSHCGTGLGLMIFQIVGTESAQRMLTDLPSSNKVVLWFGIISLVVGFLSVIRFNLSKKMKKDDFYSKAIIGLFVLGFYALAYAVGLIF